MTNSINWFEIPVSDFQRALKFYSAIYNTEIQKVDFPGMEAFEMGFLPVEPQENAVGGAIIKGEDYTPSTNGALLYLNGGNDLSECLARVEPAGGKVLQEKTKISDEIGYMALFLDTEGNKLAFHSPN